MRVCFCLVVLAIYGLFLCPSVSGEILETNFTDGDFDGWDIEYKIDTAVGHNATITRDGLHGNPHWFLDVDVFNRHTFNVRGAYGIALSNDASWTPTADGRLLGISMEIDAVSIQNTHHAMPAMRQNGRIYVAPDSPVSTGSTSEWGTLKFGPFVASDFVRLDGTGSAWDPISWNTSEKPDFVGDDTLELGFAAGYRQKGDEIRTVQRYDNWNFTTIAIPEPSSILLASVLLLGVIAKCWRSRARHNR